MRETGREGERCDFRVFLSVVFRTVTIADEFDPQLISTRWCAALSFVSFPQRSLRSRRYPACGGRGVCWRVLVSCNGVFCFVFPSRTRIRGLLAMVQRSNHQIGCRCLDCFFVVRSIARSSNGFFFFGFGFVLAFEAKRQNGTNQPPDPTPSRRKTKSNIAFGSLDYTHKFAIDTAAEDTHDDTFARSVS